jgi:predicted PurR-regulated permease PerM
LVGVILLLAGTVWFLSLTAVIFIPLVVAGVISAVAEPLVSLLERHGVPRLLGTGLVLLGIVAAGLLAGYLVLSGIGSETSGITEHLTAAADKLEGWLKDLGVSDGKAHAANQDLSAGTSDSFQALLGGVATGIEKLSSLAFFLAMTILSLIFLLKDGPTIRSWSERHMGVPAEVARTITGRTAESLRGYFLGVTIVAAFSAVLVGGGALVLGVPLAGTIAVVTFIGGYVPYLGAWTAGAFSVLIALGGSGTDAAAGCSTGGLRGSAWPASARGPGPHDRRRGAVRDRRADSRRSGRLGDRPDLSRPRASERRRRNGDRVEPGVAAKHPECLSGPHHGGAACRVATSDHAHRR